MRVVCDQCASTYKVPNGKLGKAINKATCRQCGSRLLIPKPQPGADPDERVVVPAIPPTQGVGDAGLVTPGVEDDDDKTVPVVRRNKRQEDEGDDIALISGAPISGADRAVLARARGGHAAAPPPAPVRTPEHRAPEHRAPERARAPEPEPAWHRPPPVASVQPEPAAAAPAPTPAAAAGVGDGLWLAGLGMVVALLGIVVLGGGGDSFLPVAFGLALAVCGTVTSLLVLAIGNLGQRSGQPLFASMGGVALGAVVVIALLLVRFGPPGFDGLARDAGGTTAAVAEPAPAPAVKAPVEEAAAEPEEAPVAVASNERAAPDRAEPRRTSSAVTAREPAPAPVRRERVAAPEPEPEPVRARSSGSAGSSEPAKAPVVERVEVVPEPEPEPAPIAAPVPVREPVSGSSSPSEPPSTDGLMASIPRDVIHMIITTNVGVKKCFFEALTRDREIAPPVTVSTTFNLAASGAASNLRVNNPELKGGRLERCLDTTFRTLSFPPSAKGGPITYPFRIDG